MTTLTSTLAVRKSWLQTAWQQPRKLWLRRALFQIHLWAGIAVGLFTAVAGLTGSALVYREALDKWLAPQLLLTRSEESLLSVDTVLRQVQQANPAWRVTELDLHKPGNSWLAHLEQEHKPARLVYVDPSSGRILGERGPRQGLVAWIADWHINLLAGDTGRKVNGIFGILLFVLCVSGVALWWPGRRHIRRSLRINWKARWPRLNWDLHAVVGFWISLPLAAQAFTGIYLCFFLPVALGVMLLLGGHPQELADLFTPPKSVVAAQHGKAPIAPMVAEAQHFYPDTKELRLVLPAEPDATVTLFALGPEFEKHGTFGILAFDQYSGKLLKNADPKHGSFALRTVMFFDALHFGTFAGTWSRIAWMVLGLSPALLFATGFTMWLRRVWRPARISRISLASQGHPGRILN